MRVKKLAILLIAAAGACAVGEVHASGADEPSGGAGSTEPEGVTPLVWTPFSQARFDDVGVPARVREPAIERLEQIEGWPYFEQAICYAATPPTLVKDRFVVRGPGSALARQRLLQNRFVVDGDTAFREFFELYERNRYRPFSVKEWFEPEEELHVTYLKGLPSVVTPDVIVHNVHLFFSVVLARVEQERLAPLLAKVLSDLTGATRRQLAAADSPDLQRAARDNLVFLAVGQALLRGIPPEREEPWVGDDDEIAAPRWSLLAWFDSSLGLELPPNVRQTARIELERVLRASSQERPSIFDYPGAFKEDYTQYALRGHHAKTPELTAYFRAMTWLSRMAFFAKSDSGLRSAALLALAATSEGQALRDWKEISEVLGFLVGQPDDLTFHELVPALAKVYGQRASLEQLRDPERLAALAAQVGRLEPPSIQGIVTVTRHGPDLAETRSFHFFPQRRVFDAAIFQSLVDPQVPDRTMIAPLEVPEILGSPVAREILRPERFSRYPGYAEQRAKLLAAVPTALEREKTASVYAGWMHTLGSLLPPVPSGYPPFMTNGAYAAWRLNAYMAGYAELKHDTALYGKQAMSEFGGPGMVETDVEIDVRGYVVPEIGLYARAGSLLRILREGLETRQLFPPALAKPYGRLQELVRMLVEISRKELGGEPLTRVELDLIENIGGDLEHFWLETQIDTSHPTLPRVGALDLQNAQLIADVFSGYMSPEQRGFLHVATGYVHPVWVVFARDGKLRVGRGGVLAYYELTLPNRSSDSAWRAALKEKRPPRPAWQRAFLVEEGTDPHDALHPPLD